jgi:hypothetical protein
MKVHAALLVVAVAVLLHAPASVASDAKTTSAQVPSGPMLSWGRLQMQLPEGWVVEQREDGTGAIARFGSTDEDVRVTQYRAIQTNETAEQHIRRHVREQSVEDPEAPEVKVVRPFEDFEMPGGEAASLRIEDIGDNEFAFEYAIAAPGGELYTLNFYRTGYSEDAVQRYSDMVRSIRFAAPAILDAAPVPTELVGRWKRSAIRAMSLPEACNEDWLEFGADGTLRSAGAEGQYAYIASIDTRATEHGYAIDQTLTGHSNRPNCQGLSAEYVSTHFKPDIYVEVDGDVLRFFFWERGDPYVEYRRVTPSP